MNTLIYKRTHRGDPNPEGVFGCHRCMGRVRGWDYDAVIGIGVKHPSPGDEDLALKVNWVGLRPHRREVLRLRGPLVTFKCFRLWNEKGPDVRRIAPKLYSYMFEGANVRVVKSNSLPPAMQKEVENILARARKDRAAFNSYGAEARAAARCNPPASSTKAKTRKPCNSSC